MILPDSKFIKNYKDRMENKELSIITKKLVRENANYCCESCGEQQLKPNYCKNLEKNFIALKILSKRSYQSAPILWQL